MKIHVEMTPEEYDDYRAYQKEKKTLEDKAYAVVNRLRRDHEELCNQILGALRISDSGDKRTVSISDAEAVLRVVEAAREWFS